MFKRKEKANLLEKIETLEIEISKIKNENGSLRSKLRLGNFLVREYQRSRFYFSQDAIEAQKANQTYRETVEKANSIIIEAKAGFQIEDLSSNSD